MAYEIHKMVVLSTAHITKNTADALNNRTQTDGVIVFDKLDCGWFLPVPSSDDECGAADDPLTDDLRDLFMFARERDCNWIMLDNDGPKHDSLQTWEW